MSSLNFALLLVAGALGAAAFVASCSVERLLIGSLVGLVLLGVGGLIGCILYIVVTAALHDHPMITCALAGLGVIAVAVDLARRTSLRARPAAPATGIDDGPGGGEEPPSGPRTPVPGEDLAADWTGFDRERAAWERTPVPA